MVGYKVESATLASVVVNRMYDTGRVFLDCDEPQGLERLKQSLQEHAIPYEEEPKEGEEEPSRLVLANEADYEKLETLELLRGAS